MQLTSLGIKLRNAFHELLKFKTIDLDNGGFCFFSMPLIAYADAEGDLQGAKEAFKKNDYKTAFDGFKVLAEKGNAEAQLYLGQMYRYGDGVSVDIKEVLKWVTLSAENGYDEAQLWLGKEYYFGWFGFPKDYSESLKWLKMAAEQGNASAALSMGQRYQRGFGGVSQDYLEAIKWFKKGAEKGSIDKAAACQGELGWMYENAKGVKDLVLAHMWYNIADVNGSYGAEKDRKRVEEYMSPEQVLKAQKLAKEWLEKHRKD